MIRLNNFKKEVARNNKIAVRVFPQPHNKSKLTLEVTPLNSQKRLFPITKDFLNRVAKSNNLNIKNIIVRGC